MRFSHIQIAKVSRYSDAAMFSPVFALLTLKMAKPFTLSTKPCRLLFGSFGLGTNEIDRNDWLTRKRRCGAKNSETMSETSILQFLSRIAPKVSSSTLCHSTSVVRSTLVPEIFFRHEENINHVFSTFSLFATSCFAYIAVSRVS